MLISRVRQITKCLMLLGLAGGSLSSLATPTITNVTAKQRFPWNAKVDIYYTVTSDVAESAPDGYVASTVVSVSATDQVVGATYLAKTAALSGDTGTSAGTHHIVWDLNKQGIEFKSDEVVFSVAYAGQPCPYCIIDLSAGKYAPVYPVTYMREPPSGGFNSWEYKTTKIVLRRIDDGTFIMGQNQTDESHRVTLTNPFYIGLFEVTQRQWELVTGTRCNEKDEYWRYWYDLDDTPADTTYNRIRGSSVGAQWPDSSGVDAGSFIGKLQKRTGLNFDLPTEAQWEYACRAGTTSSYNNGGDTEDDLKILGRYGGRIVHNGVVVSDGTPVSVGLYQPNAWGLFDMHGNAWEYCLDWYGELSYGTDPQGVSSGAEHVKRGGSSNHRASECTSYSRGSGYSYYDGFRLAKSLHGVEICSGVSSAVAIDSRIGIARELDTIVLPWNAEWVGGNINATVVITDNNIEVRRATGVGEFILNAACGSRHQLEYWTYFSDVKQGEVYSAIVSRLQHIAIETKSAQTPTCTEDGWTHEVRCGRCNEVLEASKTLQNLGGHVEVETKAARNPTCTEDGWTHELRCGRCNEVLEASETSQNLGGHVEVETKAAKAPTCTEDGWTREVRCGRCNEVLETSVTLQNLGGHVEVETKAARNPTCTENGWTHELRCGRCNEVLEALETLQNLGGHVEVEAKAVRDPICTEDGWTREVRCGRCNEVLEASKTLQNLGGHVEVEAKAAKAPTCTEAGWTHEVKCSQCNEILEASTAISALGHQRQTTISAITSTCTTEGRTAEVVCSRCGATLETSGILPALGHARQTTVSAIAPTCTANGRSAEVVCSRCGITLETSELLPALGHSGAITKPAVEPTSSTAGKTAEITCTRCGTILQAQTTIPALGYIRNVTARQLWPHKKVEVCYEVAEDIGNRVAANMSISLTGKYGSTTKTAVASTILGDGNCTPGLHRIVWNMDSVAVNQSSMTFTVAYSSVSGTSPAIAVNTSSSVKDGMNVSRMVNLGYSSFAYGEAKIYVDNTLIFSSPDSGSFAWQPLTTGSHILKHVSGSYTFTRTVNVTSLATAGTPSPQPPTGADADISIGTTTKAFGVEGGSSSITTAGSGTWSATASADWIAIPAAMASRNAGLPVAYQVAASTEVEPRTGYIYVSGHVFTITQAGVGAELDSLSADFETEGGTGSFTVIADAQSSWKVKSNVDWISVTTDAEGAVATSGTGEGAVYFTVAPWNEVSTRSGTITAAGCTFTVNQTGRRMKISGPDIVSAVSGLSASFDYQSHVLAVTVDALSSTEWDVELDGSWLSVVDGGSGHGGGNVAIAINENPSWLARSGSVRIGTETLAICQEGRPSSAFSFSISPAAATASVKGANAVIAVSATPDLPWTATSQANWLTIMPELQTGAGNGNVVYSASPNPTMAARTGTIQVSATASAALPAKAHTVTQPAATAMISTGSHTFAAAGESFFVAVATDDIVGWSVAENCDWLSVAGSTSRVGADAVSLVAAENPTVDPRSATVTIAGHAFVATQRGRTVEVEYEERVFGPEGGYDSLDVHPDGNAVWTALPSDPSWITIWGDEGCEYDDYGNVIGMGDATLEYIVSDYVGDGTPRTATITIGDKSVYITQRPYDLSINPSAVTVSGNAGAGEVGVPATIGQIWNAIATEPWITIIDGSGAGTGGGTVRYTYTDNDTGEERTGKIIISGEAYTITQARRTVAISARVEGESGHVGGTGTYYVGASVTLTAAAEDGYEFVNWTLPDGSTATDANLPLVADADKEIVASFRRIPTYDVNGEPVRAGTSVTFTAPAPRLDGAGTTKLVCAGTSAYPNLGTSFTLVVTGDIAFEWDLWTTNYLVTVEQAQGGQIRDGADAVATSVWLPPGSILNLTAVPDTGNSLFRWVVNGETLPTCSIRSTRLKITAPLTVSAVFDVFDDTLATALDAPALAFKTGGDADWLPVIDASAQAGYTSARSGAIGPESETWLDTTVEGHGTLTFRWRVDCEKDGGGGATWDRLSVWVNGVEAARLDGTTDWQTVTLPISAPKTTIRWSFCRDDHDEPGATHENAAWVDGVTFRKEGE